MLSPDMLDIKALLNLGVLEEPYLVFPEFLEEEPTDQAKELSEICAEEVECSPQQECGEDGTEELMLTKEEQQPQQPWQHLH